ncbi:hypothetical protein I2I11_07705 [Pontibacter sp. 172403-2]|uniref:hypothetical protein n=1 Tax=Pontibacter rufus TaxID=2791028 RepID=UPI0018AFA5F7|nr:hypothetical protein [Pontibacter sp. 172403-2]MBF9253173.1 hypothetical protein [Pontibacter sp. 172403-2]
MKQNILLLIVLLLGFNKISYSQEFNKHLNTDSLFQVILKEIPKEKRDEFKKTYEEGDEQSKEFLLFMLSMPKSSKKGLIENYKKHSVEIEKLKKEYSKLVPDSLIISIEFNAENKIISTPESIDLKVYRKNSNGQNSVIEQGWNLNRDSEELSKMLRLIDWNQNTLTEIKALLDSANCISIENGENTSIGFARSGMGKYFYLVFNDNLAKNEIEKFNDGCAYIFYKNNIVLEYGGGAVGPQCFPDE